MMETTTLPEHVETTIQKLLKLPADQRYAIGERLIQSVPPVIDEESMKEYRRRLQEIDAGSVEGIPAEEVFAEIDRMLDEEFPLSS